ncbi:DnaD-like helicase loader [Bacillus phage FI_KG-Lek]|nr:DnaD-like helicase loader [Bacillus phage FI_KG-Lek]
MKDLSLIKFILEHTDHAALKRKINLYAGFDDTSHDTLAIRDQEEEKEKEKEKKEEKKKKRKTKRRRKRTRRRKNKNKIQSVFKIRRKVQSITV